jgi:Flp pilus assembly protein TadG
VISRRLQSWREASQSGQALVEFALVLPLLLLLLFGLIDFGKAFNYWIDETHLANEGARWAAVNKNPGGGTLQQYIQQQSDSNELRSGGTSWVPNPSRVYICFPSVTSNVGDPVRVIVSVGYNWTPFLGRSLSPSSVTVTGTATMRLEAAPTNFSADGACP